MKDVQVDMLRKNSEEVLAQKAKELMGSQGTDGVKDFLCFVRALAVKIYYLSLSPVPARDLVVRLSMETAGVVLRVFNISRGSEMVNLFV